MSTETVTEHEAILDEAAERFAELLLAQWEADQEAPQRPTNDRERALPH